MLRLRACKRARDACAALSGLLRLPRLAARGMGRGVQAAPEKRATRRSKVRFAPTSFLLLADCICRKKAAVALLPCSSFSAKGPARLACSLASALTTARCRYQPFAAAAPRGAGDGAGRACRTGKTRATSEQSPLCSDIFFAPGRLYLPQKAAVAPLPCPSFSAKGPARLACSLASALTTARCRYQPFAAAAPRGAGDGAGRACRTGKRATSEQSPLCSSFSAKGPARLACSLASALTTARCRYQPFAAAAPRRRGGWGGACMPHRKNARHAGASSVSLAPAFFISCAKDGTHVRYIVILYMF